MITSPLSQVSSSNAAPGTLKTHVYNALRSAIITGRYKPGMRLNESQLARDFNISRIPIREALMQLQEHGLVMNHERRGMFVTVLSPEDVQPIRGSISRGRSCSNTRSHCLVRARPD